MRTLTLLVIVALCIFYYLQTHKEQPPAAVPAPVAVVVPAPVPQKIYYHSPLDAPAMDATKHTGSGYFSMEEKSVWDGSHTNDGTAPRSVIVNSRTAQGSTSTGAPRQ